MGVPAFFRWVCMRCPKILIDGLELEQFEYDENGQPIQASVDIDNLYLDMNGIIHPCTHPENQEVPKPLTENEMFQNIFNYIDKIMNIVRPRRILYMAIDGVAPRAKMNQQRSRRFKSALDNKKLRDKKRALRDLWEQKGVPNIDSIDETLNNEFDSNVITPGTEFMHRLAEALKGYTKHRIATNPLWRDLKIFFSDSNVPGEGEHKILEFIRQQRALENYDPNTKHCLYGADADLIMLGLSTHEPHFYIFRETIMTANEKRCSVCSQLGHFFYECRGYEREKEENTKKKESLAVKFQFVKLSIFREYLEYEFKYVNLPFPFNLERVIDDFVFMCFFVGNDFIPHLPTLDIRTGGIDCLLYIYKRMLPFMKGYLTDNGEINLMRVDVLLHELGSIEETILRNSDRQNEYFKMRNKQKVDVSEKRGEEISLKKKEIINNNEKNRIAANALREELIKDLNTQENKSFDKNEENKEISTSLVEGKEEKDPQSFFNGSTNILLNTILTPQKMKEIELKVLNNSKPAFEEILLDYSKYYERFMEGSSMSSGRIIVEDSRSPLEDEELMNESIPSAKIANSEKLNLQEQFFSDLKKIVEKEKEEEEKIRGAQEEESLFTGDDNYKEKYYQRKFKISPQDYPELKSQIKRSYVEALCWNFAYYYKGCISWKWFYPYHYSPFASDLEGVETLKIKFEQGEPLKPVEQLMGVLSPLSIHAIPSCLRHLMLDENSNIIDFYPSEFVVDSKGKKYAWLGEVLLPFIEEERLLNAVNKHIEELTEDELIRNRRGETLLYVSKENSFVDAFIQKLSSLEEHQKGKMKINYLDFKLGGSLDENILGDDEVHMCFIYHLPPIKRHNTNLLEGVIHPSRELDENLMEKIDKRFYAGNHTIRMLERALSSTADSNENFNRGFSGRNNNEMFNNDHFNNNYAHNNFNSFFNNNRAVAREPTHFKSHNVVKSWQQRGRTDNIYNAFNPSPPQMYYNNRYNPRMSAPQQYYRPQMGRNSGYGYGSSEYGNKRPTPYAYEYDPKKRFKNQ